jgi:peptidoglycan-associated lipoprotein
MVLRRLFSALMILSLAFVVSCSSKDKKEDGAAGESVASGELDSNISSSAAMNFDAEGSDSGNIPGLSSINFGYDQATLTSSARRDLAANADWIRANQSVTIQIEGHCDSRGSVEYNLALGERRAKAVKKYLVSLGVDAKRLTVISYGKEKLLASGFSDSDHGRNRRANFVPLPQ